MNDDTIDTAKKASAAKEAGASNASRNLRIKPIYWAGIALIIIIAVAIAYTVTSSINASAASTGDTVSVYYTGKFTNGTVFSTNVGGAPFNFTIGANEVIPGFNNAIIGMKAGENKTVTIPPSEAYGEVNQSLIITVPLSAFSNNSVNSTKVGMVVTTQSGQQGEIIAVNKTAATVDFNPPLAGKALVFQIKLVSIKK
ncbi:MAG: peptidylprolyl isomerase [Candidatus Micrarchaeaceae archaeon]